MTLERDMTVKLSVRDWVAILSLAAAIFGSVLTAWLHHDRLLMQIVTQQGAANARLDKIEARLERSER
jgi:hypothetical protein